MFRTAQACWPCGVSRICLNHESSEGLPHEGFFHTYILIMIITIDRLTAATRPEAIRGWRTLRTFSQTLQAKASGRSHGSTLSSAHDPETGTLCPLKVRIGPCSPVQSRGPAPDRRAINLRPCRPPCCGDTHFSRVLQDTLFFACNTLIALAPSPALRAEHAS